MNDYERMIQVIQFLENHPQEHSLATLADHLRLSPDRLHLLFSNWASIRPAEFLQCLIPARIKEMLRLGKHILEKVTAAGMSGSHAAPDLNIRLESIATDTPPPGGPDWRIVFGFADTPFGECILGECPRGICHLAFIDGNRRQSAQDQLQSAWPNAVLLRHDTMASGQAAAIFHRSIDGSPAEFRLLIKGSPFQLQAWKTLMQVPPGALVSYGSLANAIGQPSAARAAGTAVGRNPIAYLIPCHRVIRETGAIGEFRWGRLRKRLMIARESTACSQITTPQPRRPGLW